MKNFFTKLFSSLWSYKVFRIFVCVIASHWLYLLILRWAMPPITITQLSNWISGNGLKRDYVSAENISPNLYWAVVAAEDQLFAEHIGFDWKSIQKAYKKNKKSKRVRGASTISQQTAKNVFLWQGRTWIRKGLEVYFTFMVELFWSKEHILHVYLNCIEMGPGVFGAEAAAQYYFHTSAKKLSARQAALIAACLPNPKKFSAGKPSPYIQRRAAWILNQMHQLRGEDGLEEIIR